LSKPNLSAGLFFGTSRALSTTTKIAPAHNFPAGGDRDGILLIYKD